MPGGRETGREIRYPRQNNQSLRLKSRRPCRAVAVGDDGGDAETGLVEPAQAGQFPCAVQPHIGQLLRKVRIMLFNAWKANDPSNAPIRQPKAFAVQVQKGIGEEQTNRRSLKIGLATGDRVNECSGSFIRREKNPDLNRHGVMLKNRGNGHYATGQVASPLLRIVPQCYVPHQNIVHR